MTGKLLFGLPVPALITAELAQQMHDLIDQEEYCCHALIKTELYVNADREGQSDLVQAWDEFLDTTGIGSGGSGFALDHEGRDLDITDLISTYGGDGYNADKQRRKIFLTKLVEVLSE